MLNMEGGVKIKCVYLPNKCNTVKSTIFLL